MVTLKRNKEHKHFKRRTNHLKVPMLKKNIETRLVIIINVKVGLCKAHKSFKTIYIAKIKNTLHIP